MRVKQIALLFLCVFLTQRVCSQNCDILCDGCEADGTCSSCFDSFQVGASSTYTSSRSCGCPDGFYQDSNNLCRFCPPECATCSSTSSCLSCISGYEIDNNNLCAKKYSNEGQWISRNIAHELTQEKLSSQDIEGWYLKDIVASQSINSAIRNCSGFPEDKFFGLGAFDYNTELFRSYFGLPSHNWIQIKFNFVAVDGWNQTDMVLEINDRESYVLDALEGVVADEKQTFSSADREVDFCVTSTADNMGTIDLSMAHTDSMVKFRIRTSLFEATPGINGYQNSVYFGVKDVFVRVGTCPSSCSNCISADKCLSCRSPYVLQVGVWTCDCDTSIAQLTSSGKCVKNCLNGFIFKAPNGSTEEECLLCSEVLSDECLICESSSNSVYCSVCQEGFYLENGLCVEECPTQKESSVTTHPTFGVLHGTCVACPTNCSECEFGVCVECTSGFSYFNNSCVSSCPTQTYLESYLNECLPCGQNCATCSGEDTCLTCIDSANFVPYRGNCLPSCYLEGNCAYTPCDSSCSKCFGPDADQCTECPNTELLQAGTCVSTCHAGYFELNSICEQCIAPCSECVNFEICSKCQNGYHLFDQECHRECPVGHYPNADGVCKDCGDHCMACTQDQTCTACANSFTLFQGQCVQQIQCDSGKYYDERVNSCLPCQDNCELCEKDLCYKCDDQTILDNGECLSQCPNQKFATIQTVSIDGVDTVIRKCLWKDPLCKTFQLQADNSSICQECIFMNPTLVLLQNASSSEQECEFSCPAGKYKKVDTTANTVACHDCPSNCQVCLDNSECTRCESTHVLSPLSSGEQCISSCPEQYTSDGYQCLECKANCKTCQINDFCLACMTGFTLNFNNDCTAGSSCSNSSEYYDSTQTSCQPCWEGCKTCASQFECTSCGVYNSVQTYLKDGSCIESCGVGYFQQSASKSCKKCPAECLTCVSQTQCTECIDGHYLLFHPIQPFAAFSIGTCVQECAIGYFNHHPTNSLTQLAYCEFCAFNCLTCFGPSEDQCLTCYGDFKMDHNSRCVEHCPAYKYEDDYGHCDWCHVSCLSCEGPAEFQCTGCSDDQFLHSGVCYTRSCPGSTYLVDYDSRLCELCQYGCQVCSSPYNCSICTGGFYLHEGWCYLECPENTQPYFDAAANMYTCGSCSYRWTHCLECGVNKCQRCSSQKYVYYTSANASSCYDSCPSGTFPLETSIKQCIDCPSVCLTCISSSVCQTCASPLTLIDGWCSQKCPEGQFFNGSACLTCSSNCARCVGPTQCRDCEENYFLAEDPSTGELFCSLDCIDGYYENSYNGNCAKCSQNCLLCDGPSECTECASGFTLDSGYCYENNMPDPICTVDNCAYCLTAQICIFCSLDYVLYIDPSTETTSCVQECPNGYFENAGVCMKCHEVCETCSNSARNCISCHSGMYLFGNQCWENCPVGYFADTGSNACLQCTDNCYKCSDSQNCQICNAGYYNNSGKCLETCPDRTFRSGSQCINCLESCAKCQSLTSCTQCDKPSVISEGVCINKCGIGSYLNTTSLKCLDCQFPCSTCKSKHECLSCQEGYVLSHSGFKCLGSCPDGFYAKAYPQMGERCEECSEKCKTCLNSTRCQSCKPGFFFSNGRCLSECPIGTYALTGEQFCRQCSTNCIACNAETCLQCHNQTLMYDGKCISFCPSGTYEVVKFNHTLLRTITTCENCMAPCKNCNGSSVFNCLSCVDGYYYYEGQCLSNCPIIGYFKNEEQDRCDHCMAGCLVCSSATVCLECQDQWQLSSTDQCLPPNQCDMNNCEICLEETLANATVIQECLSCVEPFYLANTSLIPGFSNSNVVAICLTECPFRTFAIANFTCEACPENCDVCIEQECTSCSTDFYLYRGSCVSSCPLGYYAESTTRRCLPTICQFANSAGDCQKCLSPHLLQEGTCVLQCSVGYFKQGAYCISCSLTLANCLQCSSARNCTQCLGNVTTTGLTYFLHDGQCRTNCPIGHYLINQTGVYSCAPCSEIQNCVICSSGSMCSQCESNYFLTNGQCLSQCPDGSFASEFRYECLQCKDNCQTCLNSTYCTSCASGFLWIDGDCLTACPEGYFESADMSCVRCSSRCRQCFGSATNCSECNTPYLLSQVSANVANCVLNCPEGYYRSTSPSCTACNSSCLTCSFDKCLTCPTGLYLHSGKCLASCPSGYFAQNNKCLKCDPSCLTCSGTPDSCLTCHSGMTLDSNNNCVANCSVSSAYFSTNTSSCQSCSVDCETCYGPRYDQCLTCFDPLSLYNHVCVRRCPDGLFRDSDTVCKLCDPWVCLTCVGSATNCSSCSFPKVLIVDNGVGHCSEECSLGSFYDESASLCKNCPTNCQLCKSSQTCTKCTAATFLYQGRCVSACPSGFAQFTDSSGSTSCKRCPVNCISCTHGSSGLECTNCETGLVLAYGQCYSDCPSGTYLSGSSCAVCPEKCQTCTSTLECQSCLFPYLLENSDCVQECSSGYSEVNGLCVADEQCGGFYYEGECLAHCTDGTYGTGSNTCEDCGNFCAECDAVDDCLKCDDGFFAFDSGNGKVSCVAECPLTTYANEQYCIACPSPCATCYAQQEQVYCLTCITAYFELDGECLAACPAGYRELNSKCVQCPPKCATCDASGCIDCFNAQYIAPDCNTTNVVCSDGQYAVPVSGACDDCHAACATCYGSLISECTSCRNVSGVVYYLLDESSCVLECPQGYTANNSTNTCQECQAENCQSCASESISQCSACKAGYILHHLIATADVCIRSCSELDSSSQTYLMLNSECTSCNSQVPNCFDCYLSNSVVHCAECVSGMFLFENTCVSQCPDGTYSNGTRCRNCPSNCLSCSDGSTCTTCSDGWFRHQGQCISACPARYYADSSDKSCKACKTNCRTCDSAITCSECISPYKLDSNQCDSCTSGFYLGSDGTCKQCDSNCLTCSGPSNNCTSCAPSKYFLLQKCYSECPEGYFGTDGVCNACSDFATNCAVCSESEGCIFCESTYFLTIYSNDTQECSQNCPTSYYANDITEACESCSDSIPNCDSCLMTNGVLTCDQCVNNMYLFENSCVSTCPKGYVEDQNTDLIKICSECKQNCKDCSGDISTCLVCEDNLVDDGTGKCEAAPNSCASNQYLDSFDVCQDCHSTCLTCDGGSRLDCVTCSTPEYQLQSDGSCAAQCPEGEYYDSGLSSCALCSTKYGSECSSCDSANCKQCSSGVLATDGQSCITACSPGTYARNGNCLDCPQYCDECTSATVCINCTDSSHKFYNNLCYVSCPDGSFEESNGSCTVCDSKCLKCQSSATNCSQCATGFVLDGFACVDSCPTAKYANANGECVNCPSNCTACSSGDNCTSCLQMPTAHYLLQGSCVAACPDGYFVDGTSCSACQFPCLTCSGSATNCLTCSTGYNHASSTNTCSSSCPDGEYLSTDNGGVSTCVTCSLTNCKDCDVSDCHNCMPNFFKVLTNSLITQCTQNCPSGTYADTSSMTCVDCEANCDSCTSPTECTACSSSFFLYQSDCHSSCPVGTLASSQSNPSTNICVDCISNCDQCPDTSSCTECTSPYYLYSQTCHSVCPNGTYPRIDNTCQPCTVVNCLNCSSTTCHECQSSYFAMLNQVSGAISECLSDCGESYFEDGAQCTACLTDCKTCTSATTCEQCHAGKSLLVDGSSYSCVSVCPENYYTDTNSTSQCKSCESNCRICTTDWLCIECASGYSKIYNSSAEDCVAECPSYYFASTRASQFNSSEIAAYTEKFLTVPSDISICEACPSNCPVCTSSTNCTTCDTTHTLVDGLCVPNNCVNCDVCDESVSPAICLNCSSALTASADFYLYFIRCVDVCPVYYYANATTRQCERCTTNCINCTTSEDCQLCIPDYIFIEGRGCVNEAVEEFGAAAEMSGWTSNITETMATIYLSTSAGPVVFGEMTTTYFNIEFTQFMYFHEGASGGNQEMEVFLDSLQTMSLTNGGTETNSGTEVPQEEAARRRRLTAVEYTSNFLEVNIPIFILMFSFLAAYLVIVVFQKYAQEFCRVSCNNCWFYADTISEFMLMRFKWIYFDFIMWISYLPFLYFAVLQLINISFQDFAQGFSSILAVLIIATYPLYPLFIGYQIKTNYEEICVDPEDPERRNKMVEMSLDPYLYAVKRPERNPYVEQEFKWFSLANFILIYYPLKYFRKFVFVLVVAVVSVPVHTVITLIGLNLLFIAYIVALKPRETLYLAFDLAIEFVLLAFEVFLLTYLILDGGKIAMMSIVTHSIGFATANLSLVIAIILNLVAYYKIFMCLKELCEHVSEKVAEREEAQNKFEQDKKFLDPESNLFDDKDIGKLKGINSDSDTDEDDDTFRMSRDGRHIAEHMGQKELRLNGIDPVKYAKDLSKKQNRDIEEKEKALKIVNADDLTDSDDSMDENAFEIARKLNLTEKQLAMNQIHPVKFAKEMTKDDALLEDRYKKFDDKHVDGRLAKIINDDDLTDSDDSSLDEAAMEIARGLGLNEKQLAFNDINPVKFFKEDTKKEAPLEDRYKKFDEKHVDKQLAKRINEDEDLTDSDDSEMDREAHDLARQLELNEKQLAFNDLNPVKFFREETKKDAPLEEQYRKFDEKNMGQTLANRINKDDTDSEDCSDDSVDEDAHNLARNLELNEKQLAVNELNPLKFLKDDTKKDAPLEQVYQKFDEKHVDKGLARDINRDAETDSDEDSEQEENYRIARDLNLNEKQLAFNKINPVKMAQAEAKKDEKLETLKRQFDEKDIDMKVARMINEEQQTDSEEDSEEEDRYELAKHLELNEKDLAVNQINPMRLVKQVTREAELPPEELRRRQEKRTQKFQMTDKEVLDLRNTQAQRGMRKDVHTDSESEEDDQEDIRLTRKLQGMTEKEMTLQGMDPVKAVKKVTKEAFAKKMAKKATFDEDQYEMPDFKVSSKGNAKKHSKASKNRSPTKIKVSENIRESQRVPSSDESDSENKSRNLLDSESEHEGALLKSYANRAPQKFQNSLGEDEVDFVKPSAIAQPSRKPHAGKADRLRHLEGESLNSEQASETGLYVKNHDESVEDISIPSNNSRKVIESPFSKNLVPNEVDSKKKSKPRSQANSSGRRHTNAEQEDIFGEFEEVAAQKIDNTNLIVVREEDDMEDLGHVQEKKYTDRKNQRRSSRSVKEKAAESVRQIVKEGEKQDIGGKLKSYKDAKHKRSSKSIKKDGIFSDMMQNPVESVVVGENSRYQEIIGENKKNLKLPNFKDKSEFEEFEYDQKPKSKISKYGSNANSDSQDEYSKEVRKARNSAKNSLRLRKLDKEQEGDISQQLAPEDSKRSSQVSKKTIRSGRADKLKIEKLSEGEGDEAIEQIEL